MAPLRHDRRGEGPPMVLVHGIGHRRQVWAPVVDHLSARFETVAVDLPGFGESPPLRPHEEPSPVALTDEVEALHAPGLGHVPTWDDPAQVAATILGTAPDRPDPGQGRAGAR